MRLRLGLIGWLSMILAALVLPATALASPTVAAIAVSAGGAVEARIAVELGERVDFNLFTLPTPDRVVIDLPELRWRATLPALPRGGLVAGIRHGVFQPGTLRIVLDLRGPAQVRHAAIEAASGGGYHLIVELAAGAAVSLSQSEGHHGPVRTAAAVPVQPSGKPIRPRRVVKPVIVLDPGHGGADPGAVSDDGHYEKDLTLAMAHVFKRKLEARGRYRVLLTRDDDRFLRLRERVEIARAAGAALFMSLHADSLGRSAVRGLSIYTLSEQASDAEADALARRENKADLIAGVDLSEENKQVVNILIDLAQRETKNLSAKYAQLLVGELAKQTTLLPKPHRFAGFAVLKAPDVPSVLVELGYLSNPTDARLLYQDAHRNRLGEAITRAVDAYFASREVVNRH